MPARRSLAALLLTLALACGTAGCGERTAGPLEPEIPPPGENLLAPHRLDALPTGRRAGWLAYLDASRRAGELDRASLDAELRALGRSTWTPAPAGPDFALTGQMTEAWFRGAEARRIADNIVSFQTPSGGWSKAVDVTQRPRQPGESYASTQSWSSVGTFDNGATTEHLRFLAGAIRGHGDERHLQSFLKGVEYVFRAQYPNGCWPQIYPLQGSYHDAATFNDDAMVRVFRILSSLARGEYGFAPPAVRARAAASLEGALGCVLASQVRVNGRPTVWGQQHDPLTLVPVRARAFEPASLAGRESAAIVDFLLALEAPTPAVVAAVHPAIAWFRRTAIHGYTYQTGGELVAREGAGPLWARMYEIGTDRPIFGDRDGSVRYSLSELSEERRRGYAWYTGAPTGTLQRYEAWARRYPAAP